MNILYTCWFKAKTSQRQWEYEYCLWKNIKNPDIQKIVLFCESDPPLWVPDKVETYITLKEIGVTFDRMFRAATVNSGHNRVHIVCNSDIYFPDNGDLSRLHTRIKPNQVLCLGRWEHKNRRWVLYRNAHQGQDSWIFRTPPRHGIGCYRPGIPGCDNHLAWEFYEDGYDVRNPSLSIESHHVHLSDQRFYSRKDGDLIPRPYLLVTPHSFENNPAYRFIQ